MALSVSNGYVVYQRGADSKSPYWKWVHNRAIADAETIKSIQTGSRTDKLKEAGARLVAIGEAEQTKEQALIESATGMHMEGKDIIEFIRHFNEILMGKQQFEKAMYRLEDALTEPKQQISSRAPTIASWFSSYLGTALSKNINGFINQNLDVLVRSNFSAWEAQIDAIVDKSIDQAFQNMMTKMEQKEGKELYGDKETWKEIYEASQQIQGFNQYFRDMIRSKLDFSRLTHMLQSDIINLNAKRNKGVRKFIDGAKGLNLKNEKKSRALGGSVQEYLMSLLSTLGTGAQSASSTGTRVFSSEKLKADNVTIFSYETSIDSEQMAQEIADLLDDTLQQSTSLKNSVDLMKSFHEQYLSKLDNSFIVYGSTKSYSLSDSFRGFHGGGTRSLADAVSIIQQAGIGNAAAVEKYINVAYNTGDGAIFQSRRGEVTEDLKIALMSAVAELLFDDWSTLGEVRGGAQAIHVLQLEGLQIPSSVFFIAAGQAMISASADMDRLVHISIKLPGPIKYPNPIKTAGGHMSEIVAKWNEQASEAAAQSSFSLTFLTNFKTLITQWISF